jgi:CRISPR/Cas system CSM-associated protein Csm4 (group 5 of RAMP superfamily)
MKASTKKTAKKQLESAITEKFMHAITELGHDAEKLKKEIKKVSKLVAKKVSKTIDSIKETAAVNLESKPIKKVVKATKIARNDIENKAVEIQKEINKATKAGVKNVKDTSLAAIETLTKTVTDTASSIPSQAKRRGRKPAQAKTELLPMAESVKTATSKAKNKK